MNIDNVLDTIMQFYSWISIQTGLQRWQLLIIALVVLIVLVIFWNYQRKARLRKIRIISNSKCSEIIGVKLSNKEQNHRTPNNLEKKQSLYNQKEIVEEEHSWSQTTKDWRKLREKIMHLQHDINKHERIEKRLKEQISTLEEANKQLHGKLNQKYQIGEELQQQINELTTTTLGHTQVEQTIIKDESLGLQQTNQETEMPTTGYLESQIAENQHKSKESLLKEDSDSSDTTEKEHDIPLNIKELKAIADLVKQLQARSQQRHND
ncbi:MAG: hypothetical protein JXA96_04750 [Sedimentisphaerales bacterium]|nr:hypothetical protein [Sedimentisphaerales bacterium]